MNILNYFKKKSKKNFFNKKNIFIIFLITFIFFIDRLSKIKIIDHQINNNRIFINDYLNLDLIWNTGIAFGFLSSNTSFFYNSITILIGCILIFLVYLIVKAKKNEKFLLSIILGGALGNFYDRTFYFAVPDFIDIHYGNFHWFTFNIADIFISLGIILLIIKDLFLKNEKN